MSDSHHSVSSDRAAQPILGTSTNLVAKQLWLEITFLLQRFRAELITETLRDIDVQEYPRSRMQERGEGSPDLYEIHILQCDQQLCLLLTFDTRKYSEMNPQNLLLPWSDHLEIAAKGAGSSTSRSLHDLAPDIHHQTYQVHKG